MPRIAVWLALPCLTLAIIAAILRAHSRKSESNLESVALLEVETSAAERRGDVWFMRGVTNPLTAVLRERYPEGVVKSRSTVSNGLLEGLSVGYYTNGQVEVQESYHHGVAHGMRTKYYPEGTRLAEASIVNGALDGPFRRWHANGQLAEEIPMRAGKADGLARAWFPSGFLKTEAHLKEGVLVSSTNWKDGEHPD